MDLVELSDTSFCKELSSFLILGVGSVVPVKIFGVLALIDQGEIDWKIVTLNTKEAEEKNVKV